MCLKGFNRCFGCPEVDSPDPPHRPPAEVHVEAGSKKKSVEVRTGNPVKPDIRASDGSATKFERQPHTKASNGKGSANSHPKGIEGESKPPNKASEASGFPESSPRGPVKTDNVSSDGFPFGSQPYPMESEFKERADDDSEKRIQTKVGNKVIASNGDFQTNDSYGRNDETLETKTSANDPFRS